MSTTLAASPAATATTPLIRRCAVLGAGTMGSRIAAHLANAGVPVLLLDIVPPGAPSGTVDRSAIARQAVQALLKAKPASFYDAANAALITPGNFEDDLAQLKGCDWVIEAVTENLDIKQALLEKIALHLRPDAIVTTNTSGLPVASIASRMPADFRRRWFGTHFFNPPRYMRLLEIICTPDSDADAVAAIAGFADRRLGKAIVYAHDTPNFIANRIGVFAMLTAVELMQQMDLTIEDVDALTGSSIGWPRTGTFRLADMVGIDVLAHVARNFSSTKAEDAVATRVPAFIETMLERKWLGDKSGQGFYKKIPDAPDPKNNRQVLDWKTLDYGPTKRPKFPSLEMAKNAEALPERLQLLIGSGPGKDKASLFQWTLLTRIWNYAADCLPEIADDLAAIDRAMRTGFNWELGPFEMWDAIGVSQSCERLRARDEHISPQAEALLASGKTSWYSETQTGRAYFDSSARDYKAMESAGVASVAVFKRTNGVIRKNAGASLVDIGEGIACIELHSKKNAIGDDIVSLITQTLHPDSEPVRNFRGFVISGDASDFSVGANLMQLLLVMQEGEWDEVDLAVRAFQHMTSSIKFCPRPVVVSPFNLCLGGGVEISLHGAARQPHAELYMGLVETGVGLIPAGGGTKEMVLHAVDAAASEAGINPADVPLKFAFSGELQEALKQRFETVAMAKVSTSAAEARGLDLLKSSDKITPNRERLLLDARETAVYLAESGYAAPAPRTQVPIPGDQVAATLKLGVHLMRQAEYISDHDVKIAHHLVRIMCGGSVTPGTLVSEQYLLDLEREAFLSLCGERKTQERIAFTLKTGKPLRN